MSLFTKLHLKDDLKFTIFSLSIYKRIHGVEYQKETLVVEKGYHDEQYEKMMMNKLYKGRKAIEAVSF